MAVLTAYGMELYATNTVELYGEHRRLARTKVPVDVWASHVRNEVLPRYRKEFGYFVYSDNDVRQAAAALKQYYEDHIQEG